MATKRCIKCRLLKSTSEFYKHLTNTDCLDTRCKSCVQFYSAQRIQRGLQILQNLATTRGCCAHCQLPYSNENWHFFEFDHIDPSLKQHKKETKSPWVAKYQHEFFQRIAPNLQLLCVKCHKIKTSKELKLGGAIQQKNIGGTKPPQVLDLGWNLFNPVPLAEPDELNMTYTQLAKEGMWVTQRDVQGNLIWFELYEKYLKQN